MYTDLTFSLKKNTQDHYLRLKLKSFVVGRQNREKLSDIFADFYPSLDNRTQTPSDGDDIAGYGNCLNYLN